MNPDYGMGIPIPTKPKGLGSTSEPAWLGVSAYEFWLLL